MTSVRGPIAGQDTREPKYPPTNGFLGSRGPWLAVGALALVAGAALNWGWLVAAGIAPLLIAFLPCAVMCGLSLCAMNRTQGGCTGGNTEHAPADLAANRH